MPVEFSFGQVEAVCAHLNGIASDKRVAFLGRLKQLQKQGLTEQGGRPGRGKAGVYGFNDLMRFVIAVELIQTGMTPQRATGLINRNRFELHRSVAWWSASVSVGDPEPFFWLVKPEELAGLTFGETLAPEWSNIRIVDNATIQTVMQSEISDTLTANRPFGGGFRSIILNGSNLTESVMQAVRELGYATIEELRADLQGNVTPGEVN